MGGKPNCVEMSGAFIVCCYLIIAGGFPLQPGLQILVVCLPLRFLPSLTTYQYVADHQECFARHCAALVGYRPIEPILLALLFAVFQAVQQCAKDYYQYYVPEIEAKKARKQQQEEARQRKEMQRLQADMAAAKLGQEAQAGAAGQQQQKDEDGGESADLELSDESIELSDGGRRAGSDEEGA